jgi:transposase
MNAQSAIIIRERMTRAALPKRLANIPICLIGMEACAGSHYIGRMLSALGHDVRLIPAKYVKPFLKDHKNDYRDAEAIAEAVQRPTMRFVPLKSTQQLDLQALHRVRSRLVGQRTAIINQIRAFLLEHGIAVRQGPGALRQSPFFSPRAANRRPVAADHPPYRGPHRRLATVRSADRRLARRRP